MTLPPVSKQASQQASNSIASCAHQRHNSKLNRQSLQKHLKRQDGSKGSTRGPGNPETRKTGFRPGVQNAAVRLIVEWGRGPVFGPAWGGPGFRPENGQNAYFYSVSPSAEHFYSPAEAFRVFQNLNHGGSSSTRAPNTGAVKVRIASPFTTRVWLLPRGQGGHLPESALFPPASGLFHGGSEGIRGVPVSRPCLASSTGAGRASARQRPSATCVWPLPRGQRGHPKSAHFPPVSGLPPRGQGGPLSESALLPGLSGLLHGDREGSLMEGIYQGRLASSTGAGRASIKECPFKPTWAFCFSTLTRWRWWSWWRG